MKISEIFTSVNGEVTGWGQGSLTTFVRLHGCNLKCPYCDARYANDGPMELMTVDQVLSRISTRQITITGGEPLLQADEVGRLIDGFVQSRNGQAEVTVETNGSLPITAVDHHGSCAISWVLDHKQDGSFQYSNVRFLRAKDWVKFVIKDLADYEAAVRQVRDIIRPRNYQVRFAFSPINPGLSADRLMDWMIEDRMDDAVLNIQLHKFISVR